MALAFEDFEPRVRNCLDPLFQQVDSGKRIAVSAQEKSRTVDGWEMIGPQLVGESRAVERIREEDQRSEVRFGRLANRPRDRLALALA